MNMHKHNMKQSENINLKQDAVVSDTSMEEQIGRSIAGLLNDRAQQLDPEHEQRLSAARYAAVSRVAELQAQYSTAGHANGRSHVLRWLGHGVEQHRVASAALLLAVMFLTFFAVQHFGFNHNLENSDAFLLASDLPPEAYADKGFDAWIESN